MTRKLKLKLYLLLIVSFVFVPIFNFAQSKPEIPKLIEQMLHAMGGMDNYNNIRFLQWEFGKRIHYWDKWTGDLRVENQETNQTVIININTLTGKVYENKVLVKDENKAKQLLQKAKSWWINDSYWLLMPWKLQDPGVKLNYLKTETLSNGAKSDVLELTFKNVGLTPENKYWIYIDQTDHLIKQWAFYKNYNDLEPKFLKPWDNYQKINGILLSYNRTKEGGGPRNVVIKAGFDSLLFKEL